MTHRARTQRGITLAEVMLSLAVLIIGLLGLVKAISAATAGSVLANQFTQAQSRAQQVIEAIGKSPTSPVNVLTCLRAGATKLQWQGCETSCKNDYGGNPLTAHACVFVTLSAATHWARAENTDRSKQEYAVVFDPADLARSSWVVSPPTTAAPGSNPLVKCYNAPCSLSEVQITIGWNDDGTATPKGVGPIFDHRVTVRQVIAQ